MDRKEIRTLCCDPSSPREGKQFYKVGILNLYYNKLANSCQIVSSPLNRVLRSDVSLEDEGLSISGARIDDDRRVDIQDVTFCIRFNYKLLGRWEQRSQLIHIEDWRPEPMVGLSPLRPFCKCQSYFLRT